MITGSCLCNGVRYEYAGSIEEISLCHCSMCRKAQGSAYVAVSPLKASRFQITRGRDLLKEFRAVPHKARVFCSNCGSPIYSARDDLPHVVRLRLGTVDTRFRCSNTYHIFRGLQSGLGSHRRRPAAVSRFADVAMLKDPGMQSEDAAATLRANARFPSPALCATSHLAG